MAVAPSWASISALFVAEAGLKEITLLTSAIRNADAGARQTKVPSGVPELRTDCYEPRQVIHPEPRYEPRMVIHPEPRYLPRRTVDKCQKPWDDLCPPTAPCSPEQGKLPAVQSPIQPPWKVLPWPAEQSSRPAKVVKVLMQRPDNTFRGTILDRFL